MADLIHLQTFKDERGNLSVIERDLGFSIRRVFYIYGVTQKRGGHGHRKTHLGLIAVHGTIEVHGQSPKSDFHYQLNDPSQALLLAPEDWHEMEFGKESVLLALASEEYDPEDYFYKKYRP